MAITINIIKQVFLGPLEKKGILSKQEVSDLFANLELLLNVNQEMLNNFCGSSTKDSANLEEIDIQNVMIGEAFLSVVCLTLTLSLSHSRAHFLLKMQYFKMYTVYCSNQPTSVKVLQSCKANTEFVNFLEVLLSLPK